MFEHGFANDSFLIKQFVLDSYLMESLIVDSRARAEKTRKYIFEIITKFNFENERFLFEGHLVCKNSVQ